jgi:YHS domain-containing protein
MRVGYLLRVLLVLAVVWAVWRLLRGLLEGAGVIQVADRRTKAVKIVRDPICGTFVSPATALAARASGETTYFCSEKCRREWERR